MVNDDVEIDDDGYDDSVETYDDDYSTSFEDCTCDHLPEQHGWGKCDVDDCNCEGGWFE